MKLTRDYHHHRIKWPSTAMRNRKLTTIIECFIVLMCLGSCGTYVPTLEEPGEAVELPKNLEYRIKDHVFCELVKALKQARTGITYGGAPVIPDDFGVQMQLTLTVNESTSFSPSATASKIFPNAVVSGVNVARSFNFGFGGTASSEANRVDTLYSYYNIGRISAPGKNEECLTEPESHGSSPLLHSDLKIFEFLTGAGPAVRLLKSSPRNSSKLYKEAKFDIYSYDIKFIITTNGNINPSWRLVNVSTNTGSAPFLSGGRSRTHELLLTFGPGLDAPSQESLQTHFSTQLVQALDRLRRDPLQ